jgi:hypothetical protein
MFKDIESTYIDSQIMKLMQTIFYFMIMFVIFGRSVFNRVFGKLFANAINRVGIILHNIMNKMGRYRVINDRQDKDPYLERYYLFLKDRGNFPFNIFLHKFLKSDPDDLHDHPWSYYTIILSGGYWEHTPDTTDVSTGEIETTKKKWWGPGTIRFAKSTQRHRIELDKDLLAKNEATWTLFIPGAKSREWGFWTQSGWIKNEEYLENKKN